MLNPRRVRPFFPLLPVVLTLLTLHMLRPGATAVFAATEPSDAPPTVVRVAILNASGESAAGDRVALVLGEHARRKLEGLMGMRLEIVNVSTATGQELAQTQISYRPGYLRAALMIAKLLPGDQRVRVMLPDTNPKVGIDIEILVGKD